MLSYLAVVTCLAGQVVSLPEVDPRLGGSTGSGGQGFNPGAGGGQFPGTGGGHIVVAFSAKHAHPYSRGYGRLLFDRISTNEGGAWDSRRGQFTAPTSGLYHFTWSALSDSGMPVRLTLFRNGKEQMSSWAAKGYQTASGAATLGLYYGDKVYIEIEEGRLYESQENERAYTVFSGFKL